MASTTSTTVSSSLERVAFVLVDGIGDVSVSRLAYRTPLQAANTPFMDAIAAGGLTGLVDSVAPGLACGSDTAHLSLFGYNPKKCYRGRGAFESMGAGLEMAPGDIAFKSNFATFNPETGIVVLRRADRRFEELGPVLCGCLDGLAIPGFPQHRVSVKYATEHRCGVVIHGPGLTDAISGTDPLKDNLPLQTAQPLDGSHEALHTAAVVNAVSQAMHQVLVDHPINALRVSQGKPPANIVLLRGCGSRLGVDPFQHRHGLKACMVAPTKIIAGLGMSLGIDRLEAPGATGDYRTKFDAKARCIADALIDGGYEFGFLHVKAVDDTGHDRATELKVRYIECVDTMIGQLLRRMAEAELEGKGKFAICVTGDHSTPVEFGDHSHEPVPLAIAHVKHVVNCLGVASSLPSIDMGSIPHPDPGMASLECLAAAVASRTAIRLHAPNAVVDKTCAFDEISVVDGVLGRFPGSEVMPLIKKFVTVNAQA